MEALIKNQNKSKTTPNKSNNGRGGFRANAGRTKGASNKRTLETAKAVEESGLTPLEYMLSVMRDVKAEEKDRLSAANMAAPYVHAKLSSIEVTANVTNHEAALDDLK